MRLLPLVWRARPLLAAAVVVWGAAASCRTAQPTGAPARSAPAPAAAPAAPAGAPDVERLLAPPGLRVGILTDAPRVSIGADDGVVVWGQDARGGWSGRRVELARATFVPVAGEAPPAPAPYRVQVGSFVTEAGARAVAAKASATAALPGGVASREGRFAARVGEFPAREPAERLAHRLHRDGFPGAFVVQEDPLDAGRRLRLLETGEELARVVVLPARPGGHLSAEASPYRGVFEVRAGEAGLTVVNVVGLEEYLLGVVPNELSPLAFPELEALKAQAVAARTYALKNRGQFAARGYDLCATPTCQVYKGLASEHPLSSQAVVATRGLVATYDGALINALYTSTCGGHTEDGANVFEEGAPYLKGVACAPERAAWAEVRTASPPRTFGTDPDLPRAVGLLQSLGVLEAGAASAARLEGIPPDAEVRGWSRAVSAALHRRECPSPSEAALARRATFFEHLVGALCWGERARRLLAPGDEAYLLQVEDRAAFRADGEREAAALLVAEGVLSPFPDNTLRPRAAITRAQAYVLMARGLEKAGAPALRRGRFQGLERGALRVRDGEVEDRYALGPAVRLFRSLGGASAAASSLSLSPGDALQYVLLDKTVVYLDVAQSRHGPSSDRDSRYFRWEVRLTPREVAEAVARYGRVGTVLDLEPRRLGVSGRVVELVVRGNEGDLLLRGLRVRWGLGLRENLFVIERERNAAGAVEAFLIAGKGWGHGVGLCQVGAFGMARAGATFDAILKHYYAGTSLEARE